MKAYLPLFFQFYLGKWNIYENYRIKYSWYQKTSCSLTTVNNRVNSLLFMKTSEFFITI